MRLGALAFVLCSLVAVAPSASASAQTRDAPDLVVELPSAPYGGSPGQIAPVFVDRFQIPGRVLYRFDAVLRNVGGTLDVWRDANSGHAMQALWAGGRPDVAPDPNRPPPPEASATVLDRNSTGARFDYVSEETHAHWHFFSPARYELAAPGGILRTADKIGFCLFDGFDLSEDDGGTQRYFPPDYRGSGSQTWCGFDHPDGDFVRMGLSPGAADRYAAQREFQWIDITGLGPGAVVLRGIADPAGQLEEAGATANNVTEDARELPGVTAGDVSAQTRQDEPVTLTLSAAPTRTDVPGRRSADCRPSSTSSDCYVWADAGGSLRFEILTPPAHGTVELGPVEGGQVTATYRPARGFAGTDRFTWRASDVRGLVSRPATAQVEVAAAEGGVQPAPGQGGGSPGDSPSAGGPPGASSAAGRPPGASPAVRSTPPPTTRPPAPSRARLRVGRATLDLPPAQPLCPTRECLRVRAASSPLALRLPPGRPLRLSLDRSARRAAFLLYDRQGRRLLQRRARRGDRPGRRWLAGLPRRPQAAILQIVVRRRGADAAETFVVRLTRTP